MSVGILLMNKKPKWIGNTPFYLEAGLRDP